MEEASRASTHRRETFTSLQLQRASDQLQEAIQSARRRRSTYNASSSLSLLSESSSSSDDDDEEEQEEEEEDNDQENRPLEANTPVVEGSLIKMEKPTPEQKLRRYMVDSMGSSGRPMSLKDLLASPMRPALAAKKLQAAGEDENTCVKEKAAMVIDKPVLVTEKRCGDGVMESEARLALDVLQLNVENQAKANRDLQEQLKLAVQQIDAVVEQVVGDRHEEFRVDQKTLDKEMLMRLSEYWTTALTEWKDEMGGVKATYEEQLAEQGSRIREMEQVHQQERGMLEARMEVKDAEAQDLRDQVLALQRSRHEEKETHVLKLQASQLVIDRLQMEIEDCHGSLQTVTGPVPDDSMPSAEAHQRHVLNLVSQLKQSELRELQWEMLFEEQTDAALQVQERLDMLLEDVNRSSKPLAATEDRSVTTPLSSIHFERVVSGGSSTTSNELHMYQQRIELLEEQLRDVKEQIHCDHHQFLYEQQKWDLEKKHMGHNVEEVHSVSVKVLKLLLIREKLLKKQEKKIQKRLEKVTTDELRVREKQDSLHGCLETTMQECGVALLYVRQLAMSGTAAPSSTTLPVKPIKLVRVLKRLKALQQENHLSSSTDAAHGHHSPTTSTSTWTSGAASSDRGPTRTK